jgi:hypothetical protein
MNARTRRNRSPPNGRRLAPDLRESALNFQVKSRWRVTGDGTTMKARRSGGGFLRRLGAQQAANHCRWIAIEPAKAPQRLDTGLRYRGGVDEP